MQILLQPQNDQKLFLAIATTLRIEKLNKMRQQKGNNDFKEHNNLTNYKTRFLPNY